MATATVSSAPARATDRQRATTARRQRWSRRLPILPALVFTIVVTQVPFLVTIWYSLHRWDFLKPGSFSFHWFTNYGQPLRDQFFRAAALHTLLITTGTVVLSVVLGTGLAVLLDRSFLGRGVVRTLLITPFLIMPVAASLIWRHEFLDATYGIINWALDAVGYHRVSFTTKYPLFSVVLVLVWQWTPFMMLIILAGLQSQTSDVLEAAHVDGASGSHIFRFITLPHLRPYLELCVLLGSIYLLQNFDTVDQLVGGAPDARNIPYFIYQRSIGGGWKFGEASAFGVVVVIATIILATFAIRTLSRLLEGDT
ncbi:MAG: polyol transport system permease protein [Acidimicrobiaceae bacterium]|nr:polyol transport system permease protein [Acidimicrobiaceae bacterium]